MSYKADNTKSLTVSGTNTYTASNNMTSYISGDTILCIFTNANTGAATLNLNSLGAKAIQRNGSLALNSGDIQAGQPYWLTYNGTAYEIAGRVSTDWKPNSIPLGAINISGASFFINGGAGVYVSLDGSSDDVFFFNDSLSKDGNMYDGSDIALKLHCRLSSNGAVSDTVGLLLDYAIVKDGDNTTTTVTNVAQVNYDVSTEVADIMFDIQLTTMTGVADADTIMITVTRNSTGASADTYGGDFEIIGLEFVKV
jgi:hypothetical protein